MVNVGQLNSSNWNVQVRIAGKPARSRSFHTRKEAESWSVIQEGYLNFLHPLFEAAGMDYAKIVVGGRPSQKLFEMQVQRLGKRPEFAKQVQKITLQKLNTHKYH